MANKLNVSVFLLLLIPALLGITPYAALAQQRQQQITAKAQQPNPESAATDFSGWIKKYDSTFDGVGPEVYFLPPPATIDELLSRELENRPPETIAIPRMLSKASTLEGLKGTSALGTDAGRFSGDTQSREGWLLMESERLTELGKMNELADIHHLLACEYFRLGATEDAFAFFEMALSTKLALKKDADVVAIQHNLGALYEYIGDLTCAISYYEAIHRDALRRNNRLQQANALTRLALIKAKNGRHAEAEQELIRTIIPLYRQLRNESGDIGRILAYQTLADVYRLQNRYPEAQWFLLQSKDIIEEKGLNYYLPDIIFDLAEVKKSSGNTSIAIEEYHLADQLAQHKGSSSLVMRLAIQDALGSIYHQSGQFKEALEALSRYDYLKEQLLLIDFPF